MSHISKNKKQLLTRIRRIKGQSEAMEKALNDDVDCAAIMQQVASIRGAVNGLMTEVLEEHIREHLGVPDIEPNKRQEDIEQVVAAIRSYLK